MPQEINRAGLFTILDGGKNATHQSAKDQKNTHQEKYEPESAQGEFGRSFEHNHYAFSSINSRRAPPSSCSMKFVE